MTEDPAASEDAAVTPPAPPRSVDHRRLAIGFSVQLAGRVVSIVLSMVSVAITFRYLGVDRYGILTATIAFSGIFDAFSDIGLSAVTIRRAASGRDTVERLVGFNLTISMSYALPLWLLTTVCGYLTYQGRPEHQLGVAIVASSLIVRAVSTCLDPVFELATRFGPLAVADVASRVASIAFIAVAAALDLGLVAFFVLQLIAPTMRLAWQLVTVRAMGVFRPMLHRADILGMLREGIPLALVSVVAVVYYRADGVILSLVNSDAEVGAYGLGYRMAATLAMIPSVLTGTVFPTLSVLYAADRTRFNNFVRRVVELLLLLAMSVGLFGALLAPTLVRVFASSSAVPLASTSARLLFIATSFGILNVVIAHALIAAHEQTALLRQSCVALGVNVALNLVLDPHFGAAGAGSALLVTEGLSVVMAVLRLRRTTRFAFPGGEAVALFAAAGAAVGVWIALDGAPWFVAAPLAGLAFVAMAAALGPLRPVRLRELWTTVRRRPVVEADRSSTIQPSP